MVSLSFSPGSAADSTVEDAQRVEVLTYQPNLSYSLTLVPGVPTDLKLDVGEKVQGLALGDTLQWLVEELPGHIFIKPVREGLFTAGTLVTNRRVYQLILHSTTPQGAWVQQVEWRDPPAPEALSKPALPRPTPPPTDPWPVPTQHRGDYEIEGDAEFRPLAVFDDGRFTWIEMARGQTLPAVFMIDDQGVSLVNYVIRGHYMVIQRLLPRILLKVGGLEVKITNRHYDPTIAP